MAMQRNSSANLHSIKKGRKKSTTPTVGEFAKLNHTSRRNVFYAMKVRNYGVPELFALMASGEYKVPAYLASRLAMCPTDDQLEVIELLTSGQADSLRHAMGLWIRIHSEAA
jgi:hypothetical protein